MNVMAAICNSISGRRLFASLTWSPGLNERAPVCVSDILGRPANSKETPKWQNPPAWSNKVKSRLRFVCGIEG